MKTCKNILISPLNWGLGHATRIIPVIDYCVTNGKNVIIGGNGSSLELLKIRYPNLVYVNIPARELKYGTRKAINIRLVVNLLIYLFSFVRGRMLTKSIVKKYNIDTIISDNRPEIFYKKSKSFYITHQVNVYISLKENIISRILTKMHRSFLKKYNFCLVADIEGVNSISGRLSMNTTGLPLKYMGPISRFSLIEPIPAMNVEYDIVCIVSGPEPQRSIFENILIEKFSSSEHKILIFRGLPGKSEELASIGNIVFVNHCEDSEFLKYLLSAGLIICRSGYSTIMDLMVIGKKALLIPTPGQPEQEYLAIRLSEKHGFVNVPQESLKQFCVEKILFKDSDFSFEKYKLKKILDLHL